MNTFEHFHCGYLPLSNRPWITGETVAKHVHIQLVMCCGCVFMITRIAGLLTRNQQATHGLRAPYTLRPVQHKKCVTIHLYIYSPIIQRHA